MVITAARLCRPALLPHQSHGFDGIGLLGYWRRQCRSKSVLCKLAEDAEKRELCLLLDRLRNVDTAALCDADKAFHASGGSGEVSAAADGYVGLGLMKSSMRPRNYQPYASDGHSVPSGGGREDDGKTAIHGQQVLRTAEMGRRMVGLAKTVQCSKPNDFFAVVRGLDSCKAGDVLVVNTLDSTRAVAGGLFLSEASRRRMGGIVIDGSVRDMAQLAAVRDLLVYSTSVTPYSGTVQSLGEVDVPVTCGGIRVCPGDVIVGDGDGVVCGSRNTFEAVIESAENIVEMERLILRGLREGHSLHSMMNYKEHLDARSKEQESTITFKKTRLNNFRGLKPLNYD